MVRGWQIVDGGNPSPGGPPSGPVSLVLRAPAVCGYCCETIRPGQEATRIPDRYWIRTRHRVCPIDREPWFGPLECPHGRRRPYQCVACIRAHEVVRRADVEWRRARGWP